MHETYFNINVYQTVMDSHGTVDNIILDVLYGISTWHQCKQTFNANGWYKLTRICTRIHVWKT